MFTVEEFISQYSNYKDEELYDILVNMDGYSPEAKQALEKVIEIRGGRDALIERLRKKEHMQLEKNRIIDEVSAMAKKGVDKAFVEKMIYSGDLEKGELNALIDNSYRQTQLEIEDKKIKPRTIIGAIIGIILATLIGGFVTGWLRMWLGEGRVPVAIPVLLFVGLILGCGLIVKFCTGQSYKNLVVIAATCISVILAIVLSIPMLVWVLALSRR